MNLFDTDPRDDEALNRRRTGDPLTVERQATTMRLRDEERLEDARPPETANPAPEKPPRQSKGRDPREMEIDGERAATLAALKSLEPKLRVWIQESVRSELQSLKGELRREMETALAENQAALRKSLEEAQAAVGKLAAPVKTYALMGWLLIAALTVASFLSVLSLTR